MNIAGLSFLPVSFFFFLLSRTVVKYPSLTKLTTGEQMSLLVVTILQKEVAKRQYLKTLSLEHCLLMHANLKSVPVRIPWGRVTPRNIWLGFWLYQLPVS